LVVSLDKYRKTRNLALSVPFGEWLKTFREDMGMTQRQLYLKTGYSQSVISRWETGVIEVYPHEAAHVALALGERRLAEYYCCQCPMASCMDKIR
jgi:ribosome-binding protein aMBF1 (putative translation factor)